MISDTATARGALANFYRPQMNGKIERLHRTCLTAGPTRTFIAAKTSDEQRWQDGYTSTTTPGPTQQSGKPHPSPGWTTWLGITPAGTPAPLSNVSEGGPTVGPR